MWSAINALKHSYMLEIFQLHVINILETTQHAGVQTSAKAIHAMHLLANVLLSIGEWRHLVTTRKLLFP